MCATCAAETAASKSAAARKYETKGVELHVALFSAASSTCDSLMHLARVVQAGIAHPFGDERTVQQAFPSAVSAEEADPFLMCDYFNMKSNGPSEDPDHFPVDWHPHRGMDILSYFRTGIGRHGDSLGNRETFATPGMQWMSVGSGVEHAEGGATPEGETQQGFQIWLNVPAKHKMDDPSYGTEPPEAIPQEEVSPGAKARLLAGPMGDRVGAFKTRAKVQVVDFDMAPGSNLTHRVPTGMDTTLLYVYEGAATVNGEKVVGPQGVAVFDSTSDDARNFTLAVAADAQPVSAILFSGRRINEPIAWYGPIVMNTQAEIQKTFQELRAGAFPPVRVPWDYHYIKNKPTA